MTAFWISLFVVLVAEMGDKTQLVALAFATRYEATTVLLGVFLAELGDKTMLATVTVASEQRSFVPVWLGSSVGMVIADSIAVVLGKLLGKRLPEKPIKYGAAAVFIVSGLYTLWTAVYG